MQLSSEDCPDGYCPVEPSDRWRPFDRDLDRDRLFDRDSDEPMKFEVRRVKFEMGHRRMLR